VIRGATYSRVGKPLAAPAPKAGPPVSEASTAGEISRLVSAAEHHADAVVHAVGVALAIVGAFAFAWRLPGDVELKIAVWVYLSALVASFCVSAAYNLWPVTPLKRVLRRIDHSAIYLLIAGTYTPFLVQMKEVDHLIFVWVVAAVGVFLKVALPGRFHRLSVVLYLALGWSGLFLFQSMSAELSTLVVALIAIGGIVYSLGVIVYAWSRLKYQRAIWHAFVVVAATFHYAAIWAALIP
jgi:hemolysin III